MLCNRSAGGLLTPPWRLCTRARSAGGAPPNELLARTPWLGHGEDVEVRGGECATAATQEHEIRGRGVVALLSPPGLRARGRPLAARCRLGGVDETGACWWVDPARLRRAPRLCRVHPVPVLPHRLQVRVRLEHLVELRRREPSLSRAIFAGIGSIQGST